MNAEPAKDRLVVNGLAGNDSSPRPTSRPRHLMLSLNGETGDDSCRGSRERLAVRRHGDDMHRREPGQRTSASSAPATTASSGINGDGSDVVEGGAGFDTMVFNGMAGGETFDASANGGRLRFFRQQGNIVMDVDDTERVDLRTLGGADATTVNDLSATESSSSSVDLAAAIGGTPATVRPTRSPSTGRTATTSSGSRGRTEAPSSAASHRS